MRTKLVLALSQCLLIVLITSALPQPQALARAQVEEPTLGFVELTLELPEYKIKQQEGYHAIDVEGFATLAVPYQPMLPHKLYDVLLPPAALPESLELEIVDVEAETLPGNYNIQLAPLPLPNVPDKTEAPDPGTNVQATDAAPYRCATLLSYSQMRQWTFARLDFVPFHYDNEARQLTVTSRATVRVHYTMGPARPLGGVMGDGVMEDIAADMFVNFDAARIWYPAVEGGALPNTLYDYVIITSDAIETNSTKLDDFVAYEQAVGHSVLVITEGEFGSLTGQLPDHKAEKIRQWLKNNYVAYGIKYVLLIGNPSPYESGEGDIPMKMCWPRRGTTYEPDHVKAPTDYFYADLTGNWDYDGDQYYGEWDDDYGPPSGVDLTPEVYVGRIPVYGADYASLDSILQKIVDYGFEGGSASWRESILLPMSFSTTTYDGAPLAEQMRDDYLISAGYSSWRQYQQGHGACGLDSLYPSEQELRGGTVVRSRWAANDYGVVCWWGHGSETEAFVGCEGCWDGYLFTTGYAPYLDDDHPAFTYQCSCFNGYPETSSNLQYAILKNGGIGTVSATRASWFSPGVGYGQFDGSTTNSGIGYEYVKRLVQGKAAAEALYQTKSSMTPSGSYGDCWLMNLYEFNLYGDPALSIEAPCIDRHEPNGASGQATPLSYATPVSDSKICPAGDVDWYSFVGSAGDNIIADIDAQSFGSYLDSYLHLYDTDGVTELAHNDDDGASLDSRIEYTLPAAGTYYLMVREYGHPSAGGPDYFYTITLWRWRHRVYLPLTMKNY